MTNLDILTCIVQKERKILSTWLKSRMQNTHYTTLPYEVFKSIQDTFEINNASRLLTLKQLLNIKMDKGDAISSYFSKIFELRDQLSTIGNNVVDVELSIKALRGLPLSWESLIQCISRPSLPKFDQLKNDCTQEESQLISRGIISNKEEEIQASQEKSSNKKGNFKRKRGNKNYMKRDLSKVQCFRCDKLVPSHVYCLKRKKNHVNLAEV